jgi:hypothetical protein
MDPAKTQGWQRSSGQNTSVLIPGWIGFSKRILFDYSRHDEVPSPNPFIVYCVTLSCYVTPGVIPSQSNGQIHAIEVHPLLLLCGPFASNANVVMGNRAPQRLAGWCAEPNAPVGASKATNQRKRCGSRGFTRARRHGKQAPEHKVWST